MSETVGPISSRVDRSLFSLHPEEEIPLRLSHDKQLEYFKFALQRTLPDLFVARNLAVYWVPGEFEEPWAGPDIFVSRHHPKEENAWCYLTYEDGPLALVIDVASAKTQGREAKLRDETYGQALAVPEHLFIDMQQHVLELSVLVNGRYGRYERVVPDADGCYWSKEFGFGFQWQRDGRLVRMVTRTVEIVPTTQEETVLRYQAEARLWEARLRQAQAEVLAAQEPGRRLEAEARAAELAAEVERARRAVGASKAALLSR
jgi:hypothetical protein